MKTICSALCVCFFPALSFAITCFNESASEEARAVLHISSYRNVWSGFEKERLIHAFSNQHLQQTVILGMREQELQSAQVSYEHCEFDQSKDAFFIKDAVDLPSNGLYEFRLISDPGTDALGKIAKTSRLPIVQIKIPNDFGFNRDTVARVAIHEAFHGVYQFSSGSFKIENFQPRDFLETCRQVKPWYESTLSQNSILAEALKEDSPAAFLAAWKKMKQLRNDLESDPSAKPCLDAQRFWERIEGSAYFVETEAAHQAGILSLDALNSELLKSLDSEELSESFFYYSGGALIRIAKSLGFESWRERIDEGTLIDALE